MTAYETTDKLKTFKNFNYESALQELWDAMPDEHFPLTSKIRQELETFDYIKTQCSDFPKQFYAVTLIDERFKNKKITLYRLCDGNSGVVKIKLNTFLDYPLALGDIIRVDEYSKEKRWIKTSNGFEQSDEYETILKKYTKIIDQ